MYSDDSIKFISGLICAIILVSFTFWIINKTTDSLIRTMSKLISVDVLYDSTNDLHLMTIKGNRRMPEDECYVFYELSNGGRPVITDRNGNNHRDWFTISLKNSASQTFILSGCPTGKNLLKMTFVGKKFCKEKFLVFDVEMKQ